MQMLWQRLVSWALSIELDIRSIRWAENSISFRFEIRFLVGIKIFPVPSPAHSFTSLKSLISCSDNVSYRLHLHHHHRYYCLVKFQMEWNISREQHQKKEQHPAQLWLWWWDYIKCNEWSDRRHHLIWCDLIAYSIRSCHEVL